MKVVILAGGYGTRLGEETSIKPKPMVEIGGKPILWHIMKIYSKYGFNEFVICLGYKGYKIKEYFSNYFLHQSDVTFDLQKKSYEVHNNFSEPWKVTLVDTGLETMTGGRIRKIKDYVGETFMLTYGDGVADINLDNLLSFHNSHKKCITMTSTQPEGRFGSIEFDDSVRVRQFIEKPKGDGSWINIGFFVVNSKVFDYISNDDSIVFEKEPLEKLAKDGELYTYHHNGFWRCMDSLNDKNKLEKLWKEDPLWKIW